MSDQFVDRLTRLRLSTFLAAERPEEVLVAAYGRDSVVAVADAQGGELHFLVLRFQGHLYALFLGNDVGSDESWSSPAARTAIAFDAVCEPHAGPATDVQDLIQGLVANEDFADWTEIWPSGHLLRALLATLPERDRLELLTWIGLGWPAVAQRLDAQERLTARAGTAA